MERSFLVEKKAYRYANAMKARGYCVHIYRKVCGFSLVWFVECWQ